MHQARIYGRSNTAQAIPRREFNSNSMNAHQADLIIGSRPQRDTLKNNHILFNSSNTITIGRRKEEDVRSDKRASLLSAGSISDIGNEMKSAEALQLTVWFHELRTSEEDIMLDPTAFPGAQIGDVYELEPFLKLEKLYFSINPQNWKENIEQTKSKIQISLLANPLQAALDIPPRSLVQVKKVLNINDAEADSIEVYFKDINLARDSMWHLSSQLVNTCAYSNKRFSFLNSRSGIIKHIYKNGKKVFSGYISQDTKIVFRSESAKLVFLIQLSREMWHFEENGEIMFHKLVNSIFPKLFKRYRDNNTHHSVTIVLFTSVDLTDIDWLSFAPGERPNTRRDYFRVVVDQVHCFHWDKIMANLRIEFANFKRDIMLKKENNYYAMEGETLPSVKGNILEALNLGISLVSDRFRDTDLKHTLNHFILITPGTGIFEVDYNLMLETSKKMTSIDSALDIFSLSQPPLHIVPLFCYKVNGKLSHCIPTWCDISFYQKIKSISNQWIPRCKIYELQMMGVMASEVNEYEIERFEVLGNSKSALEAMDKHDNILFQLVETTKQHKEYNQANKDVQKFRSSSPKDTNATLSLIWNNRVSLPHTSTAKTDISTTISSASGTVANTDTTALSSLYFLNKSADDKTISKSKSIQSLPLTRPFHTPEKKIVPRKLAKENLEENEPRKPISKKVNPEKEPEDKLNLLWSTIDNPSRQYKIDNSMYLEYSRWKDVFPLTVKRKAFKWRSLLSPSALPITTEIFPTTSQLETNYTFQIYTVFLNSENQLEIESSTDLMREMIQLRLLLGFQICFGEQVKKVESERVSSGNVEKLLKYFPKDNTCLGARIFMTHNDEIHRIFCDYNGNINVQLYRKIIKQEKNTILLGRVNQYSPLIRTRYADEYTDSSIDYQNSKPKEYNWNQFDQLIAGFDDAMPNKSKDFHKMKFVVLPADIPKNAYFVNNESLSDEEIRVEGLRKLISMIEREKYTREKKNKKKEEILPEISFYTGNLYDFLNEQAADYDLTGNQSGLMLRNNIILNRSIKLLLLAQELQNPNTGLKLVDRTWHFKTHLQCFLGNELVSWLIECFEDIYDREEATVYGQGLMDKGLFRHVEARHGFLDGYYFYEFEDEYADKSYKGEKSSWFSMKKSTENSSKNNSDTESVSSPVTYNPEADNESSRSMKTFNLSRAVKYNVDPLKKSFRPEIVTVHYDCVHNPEHCYHIRLQWLNTTTKFIDDTISNWSRLLERHGLKLIETPWQELCTIPKLNPFHSFVDLSLSLNPWTDPEFLGSKIFTQNRYFYHLYLLKKSDFLLDNRTTVFFKKSNIDITYSWGLPTFQYAQFIHKTGFYIVELRDNGGFFMSPNNIHIARINLLTRDSDPQKVMLNFRSACKNESLLRDIFREAQNNWREEFLEDFHPNKY